MSDAVRSTILTGGHREGSTTAALCGCREVGGLRLLFSLVNEEFQVRWPVGGKPDPVALL